MTSPLIRSETVSSVKRLALTFAGLCIWVSVFAAPASARHPEKISFEELSQYFATTSSGLIQESPLYSKICRDSQSACGSFHPMNRLAGWYWDTTQPLSDELLQDLFSFDQSGFIEQQKTATFAEAKEKYYSQLPFNDDKAAWELPFENLRAWGTLNHPPIKKLTLPVEKYLPELEPRPNRGSEDHIFFDEEFERKIDRISNSELTATNQLRMLPGRDAYDAKMALIRNAKKFIWVQVMVFMCDPQSEKLIDAMIEKRKEGVEVRMMLEGLWMTLAGGRCLHKMRKGGLDVVLVADTIRYLSMNVMHTKQWIRDGEEGIFGGKNMHESEDLGDGFNDGFRDTDLHIEGPAITDMMSVYARTWGREANSHNEPIGSYLPIIRERENNERALGLRGVKVYSETLKDPVRRMQGVCRVLSQTRMAKDQPILPTLTEYASASSRRMLLTTPKFRLSNDLSGKLPSDGLVKVLAEAANKRGVRVDLLTNGVDGMAGDRSKITRRWAEWARQHELPGLEDSFNDLNELFGQFDAGTNQKNIVRFLRRSPNFHAWHYMRYSHQKVHLFDRLLTGVGSFNLDNFSGYGNHEGEVFCLDQSLAEEAEALFARDVANSTPAPRAM